MTITPALPTPFTTPVANPSVGASGGGPPYISPGEFLAAPTALDTTQLIPGEGQQAQLQALADTVARASAIADRICMGQDVAAKGASLAASVSVESAIVPVVNGALRLVCDYKPIVQVNGINVGYSMADLQPVGSAVQQAIQIGRRTIIVPLIPYVGRDTSALNPPMSARTAGKFAVLWSYVNGWPHMQLAEPITAGATTCVVGATDGGTGVLGVVPGATQLTIRDGASTETFAVSAVTGTTLTSATPFQFGHSLPQAPDFLPVTALPADIQNAALYLTMFLIKTRGDSSLVLDPLVEPKQIQRLQGDQYADYTVALSNLEPYRVRIKGHN